jgi:molybdopterin-synthase adenylyltransferase
MERTTSENTLPLGHLAEEVHIAVTQRGWRQITERLRHEAPNEGCTFVLVRPSRGKRRVTAILGEILWPESGEVAATPERLEISADYITRALEAAIDAGPLVGVCLVHTHPRSRWGRGVGVFSPRDDWYEKRLFPTLTTDRSACVCGSIVIGSAGDVDARVWWWGGSGVQTQPVQAIRIVGPELTVLETPASTWRDHPDPSVMDRSTRLWGDQGRKRLQNLRIGIAGVGGTGSLSAFALATMGVGKLSLWDKDIGKKENRHRTVGISSSFVGQPKVEALAALARSVATANPFEVEPFEDWATSEESLEQLKDCDIIFSCVDKLAPRVPLNDLAYLHLIPVIDMASWMHVDRHRRVDALVTHAHVWSPEVPCAWCRGTLSSYLLMQEAQGSQRGIERRVAYGLPLDETDGVEPSVLPLNMLGVSLALMEFLQVALRITSRTPNDLKFFLPEWELDESDLRAQADCVCTTSIGMGDATRIRPVVME